MNAAGKTLAPTITVHVPLKLTGRGGLKTIIGQNSTASHAHAFRRFDYQGARADSPTDLPDLISPSSIRNNGVPSSMPDRRRRIAAQPKISPQRRAFVICAKNLSTLQLGYNAFDEIVQAAWEIRHDDVETVSGLGLDPFLHAIGDLGWRANHLQVSARPGKMPGQLADR